MKDYLELKVALIGIGVFLLLIFMSGVKDSSYGSTSPYGSPYGKYRYYKTNSSNYKSSGGTGSSSSGGISSSHHSSSSAYESHKSYDAGYNAIYEEDDYDWDRYMKDSDYADGVDDALDDIDW